MSTDIGAVARTMRDRLANPISALLNEGGSAVIVELNPDDIKPNPYQPRRHIDDGEIDELAQSIEKDGLISPIGVCEHEGGYMLLFGQRRLLAHKKLNRPTIQATVREGDPIELSIIENMQRVDLSPLDAAEALARLRDERNLTLEQIGERISKAKSTVSELLSIASLPDDLKALVRTSKQPISKSLLIEVTRLDDVAQQRALIEQARAGGATVRAARERAATGDSAARPAKSPVERLVTSCKSFVKRLGKVEVEDEIKQTDFAEILALQAEIDAFVDAARKKNAKLRKVTASAS